MRHGDWHDEERDRARRLRDREDYGQADYSNTYGYDPQTRSGYRALDEGYPRPPEDRAWDGRPHDRRPDRADRDDRYVRSDRDLPPERRPRREGPSDRVLWAVITERLDDERRLDLRDVEVTVQDAEVTLTGTVRHKADKRRIEDVADIEGVRNVQNNLRVRERSRWTLF